MDAMTTGATDTQTGWSPFRYTRDGRRVVGRFSLRMRRVWFLVPDAEAEHVRRRFQFLSLLSIGLTVGFMTRVFAGDRFWPLALIGALLGMCTTMFVSYDLQRVEVDASELVPFDAGAHDAAWARSAGAKQIGAFIMLALVLAAGQLWVLLTEPEWWAWVGLVGFGGSAGYFAWMLRYTRSSDTRRRRE